MLFLTQAYLWSAHTLSTPASFQYLHTFSLPTRGSSQSICISSLYFRRIPRIDQAFLQSVGVLLSASLLDPNLQAILARHSDVMLGHVLLGGALEGQRVEVDLVADEAERCDGDEEEDEWKEGGDCGHREVVFGFARYVKDTVLTGLYCHENIRRKGCVERCGSMMEEAGLGWKLKHM
jgi:hypothetical protein